MIPLFLILLALVVLVALLVAGVVAVVYLFVRQPKSKPEPVPAPPPPVAAAAAPPSPRSAPPVPAKTVVMPRQCPRCGTTLPPDAPEGLCPGCLLQRGFATEAGVPQPAFVPPTIAELAPLFPQLEILECLGRGGMGAVYKARQPLLDRLVALKILAPEKQTDPQFAERFEREARVLAKLSHPHIVSVYDFGVTQGRYYLLMEFVDGLTLRQLLQNGKLPPPEALQYVPQICDALQYAHQQGIVHRDIKPENILLDKQNQLKIADFGIAKIAGMEAKGLSLTGARDVVGTPNYMAPEQVEKPQAVDHRADIYSLGVVFYEMLTGELPLGKFALPSQKARVDERLDNVVLHALEKEPEQRYQQASQVKTAVENISGTPPHFAPSPMPVAPAQNPPSTGLITAPAVALMVVGVWKLFHAVLGTVVLSGMKGWLGGWLGLDPFTGSWSTVAILSVLLFKVIPGVLILYGGYQMLQRRGYGWAVAAGILSIVACSLLGLPVGIWALVVLARQDVQAVFGGASGVSSAPASGRFWRNFLGILGGVLLLGGAATVVMATVVGSSWVESALGQSQPDVQLTPQQLQEAGIHQTDSKFHKDMSQSFPLAADGWFSIDNANGHIEIQGWDSNLVTVATSIEGKSPGSILAVNVNIDSDEHHGRVHTVQPSTEGGFLWNWFDNRHRPAVVDYVVHVPRHAQLEEVRSVNGSISIDGVTGDITTTTVNGGTQVRNAAHNLAMHTVNGSLSADLTALGSGQSVSMHTVNGRISLAVPEDANADFSVRTVNGGISSEFTALKPEKKPGSHQLNGSLGHADASVELKTVNGSVEIRKSPAD